MLPGHSLKKKNDEDPGRMTSWKQHFYQYKCDDHGFIGSTENGKAPQCLKCKELPKEKQCKKELKAKLSQTDMKKPIGVFIKDYFEVFIRDKYRQHWWLKKALGTQYCLAMREKVLLEEPMSVLVCRDYTDRLSMEYNDAAMSTGMGGGNATVGMEDSSGKSVVTDMKTKKKRNLLRCIGRVTWRTQNSKTPGPAM
jgi:hypothetical protein